MVFTLTSVVTNNGDWQWPISLLDYANKSCLRNTLCEFRSLWEFGLSFIFISDKDYMVSYMYVLLYWMLLCCHYFILISSSHDFVSFDNTKITCCIMAYSFLENPITITWFYFISNMQLFMMMTSYPWDLEKVQSFNYIEVLNIILFKMIKNCKKTFKKLFNGRCSTLAECHYQVIFKSLLQLRLNPCKTYCFSLKFIYQFLLDVKLGSQCWDPVTSF